VVGGASYHFSKLTNLYAEVDFNRYDGALVPSTKQTSQRAQGVGLMKMFRGADLEEQLPVVRFANRFLLGRDDCW
jgi:hypothetical protein